MHSFRERVINNIKSIQRSITESLEAIEGREFDHDSWERPDGHGRGQVNLIQDGSVFDKGGINYTELEIPLSKTLSTQMSERGKNIDQTRLSDYKLFATGVSLVIHPKNPMIPTIHANYRYLELVLDEEIKD